MTKGLSKSTAAKLLQQYGLNSFSERNNKNIFIQFFEQFNNFLTILLLIAAVVSLLIGETIDGGLIIAIVILNGFFGLYQERKADQAVAILKKMSVTKVRVFRDGKEVEIDSRFLVPGDVVFVEEGSKIAADGKIVEAVNLEINESSLTGESVPVAKTLADEVFLGSSVSRGRGLIEVTKTGDATKFGQIASNIFLIDETETPLQKKLKQLTRFIGILGISCAALVFVLATVRGLTYFPAFLLAVSLAVAVVPEGLPAVMTITLSIGISEMSKRKAIVRKLSAIEALGSITLIATDKTGTLTSNKMKVKEILIDGKKYSSDKLPSPENEPFSLMLLDGILCSTASLVETKNPSAEPDVLGDPTEGALLFVAKELGMDIDHIRAEWQKIDEMSFDSVTKRMSVTVKKGAKTIVLAKGSPESMLDISNTYLIGKSAESLTAQKKRAIEKQVEEWASHGLRVLAFGFKNGSAYKNDLTFVGMVAIHDAPRPEAAMAVSKAREAGIRTVMITGDNAKTAEAIAISLGIMGKGDELITGPQLDQYSDRELMPLLQKIKVFARTTPFQKHRIVKLFQTLGEIVAVTGDGVNDAIALKQADVGIAMGLIGTDVAREAADMVIVDDNFATIVAAVAEGRNIIKNIKNAIKYLLACNIGEAISLIIALFMGIPTIFFPIQLLYINLITDGFPALALGFSPRNNRLMEQSPKKDLVLFEHNEIKYIVGIGFASAILVLFSYTFFTGKSGSGIGRTAAFSVMTLVQSFIFIDLWLGHLSIISNIKKLFSPMFFVAFILPFFLQFFILFFPHLSVLFKTETVSVYQFAGFVLIAGLISVLIEGAKNFITL